MRFVFFVSIFSAVIGCTFTEKIQDGNTAYERKRFYQASEMLIDEYENASSNIERGNAAYLLGESHIKYGNITGAAKWYKDAYELGYGANALLKYARTLKQQEQYQQAMQYFQELLSQVENPAQIRAEIAYCRQALVWKSEKKYSPYRVAGIRINSSANEYGVQIPDGKTIVFTSDREDSEGELLYGWTGQKFSDLYKLDVSTREVSSYSDELNTEDNEGNLVFNADASEMMFCRCLQDEAYDQYCHLFYRVKQDGQWTSATKMPFSRMETNDRQPTFSTDGSFIIFSSDRNKETNAFDLFISYRNEEDWSEPVPMTKRINTEYDEAFPYLHNDTLYFSSNRPGMGGLDIYKTYPDGKGAWIQPQNLRYPLNSGGDDFGLIINPFGSTNDSIVEKGFFSSNRLNGKGFDDIYAYQKMAESALPDRPEDTEEIVFEYYLDFRTTQKEYRDNADPNSYTNRKIPNPNTELQILKDGLLVEEVSTDNFGLYDLELELDATYTFRAKKEGFFVGETTFETFDLIVDSTLKRQRYDASVLLERIFLNTEVVLENIYYDFEQWFIREDAKPSLDTLATLLLNNPDIEIQLASHTDCRGTELLNQDLSQKRAESAVRYLVEKGISTNRLTAKGFGKSELINKCPCTQCSEEEHQENRRTTFAVIE